MKRIIGIILCCLCVNLLSGQGFKKAEYFFDADPGINNGFPLGNSATGDTIKFTANISIFSLSQGFHFLGLRVQQNDGVWSMFESRRFYISQPANADVTNIVAAEYFFDTDPGPGNGVATAVGASGDIVNFTAIIPASLPQGFHFLAIRTKDAEGKWGMFESRRFYISQPANADVTNIVAAEYFFDTDPGAGNGIATSVGASGGTVNFTAAIPASLSQGFHLLGMRTKDADGKWGLFESRRFYISQPANADVTNIVAAEYFFDTDPGPGNGIATSVGASGGTVNFTTVISTSLPTGFHLLGIRTKDADGKWGLFESRRFYISPNTVADVTNITAAEYFFDTDPGVGKGNPLAVPAPGAIVNLAAGITVPCLSAGQHRLAIRVRDQSNHWGLFGDSAFTVTSGIGASVVTPAGPLAICADDSVILSAALVSGINYQWLLAGNAIVGATANSFTVHAAGNYSLKTECGGVFVTSNVVEVSITANVDPGAVSGITPLCTGTTVTYTSNGKPGGTWSSTNESVATVNPVSGLVTTVGQGTTDITYTLIAGCGSPVSSFKTLTVNVDADAGIVSGATPLCIGAVATYTCNGDAGGTWNSSDASVASVNASTGVVTANSAGTVNIIYTVTKSGCTRTSQQSLMVSPNASAGTISGTTPLCPGITATFSSSGDAGGTWSSSNTGAATVNTTSGMVTAVSAGTANVIYTVSTGCNSPVSASKTLTVSPNVSAGTVSGTTPLCLGETAIYLSSGTAGGAWSSSDPSVATVNATTGLVAAITGGTTDITYSVSTGCGSPVSSLRTVTVTGTSIGNAGTVSGTSPLCIGTSSVYNSSGDAGGSWSSSNAAVATVNPATGEVNALSAGTANIVYTINGCKGLVTALKKLTVNPNATAGVVSGVSSLCTGASAFYLSNGTTGGSWTSSQPSVAIVNALTGLVAGVSTGSADIIYTVSGCGGTFNSAKTVTIGSAVSAGTITGSAILCISQPKLYTTNGTAGGTWSSNNTAVATVNSLTGLVTPISLGTATISYTISGCNGFLSASRIVTVIPTASAGIVSGPSQLCIGGKGTFTSSGTAGGTWSSSNNAVATVNSSTGFVSALSEGATAITYTLILCDAVFTASKTLTVAGQPPVFSFSGNPGFTSSVVSPAEGEPNFNYEFEVMYTDASGELPATGFPTLMLDFEGNGILTDPKDMNIIMSPLDAGDLNVIDGKVYKVVLSGLPLGTSWMANFYARATGGCETQSQFAGPKIMRKPNLSIFANDITFSNNHPDISSSITVSAVIHNDSSEDAQNFTVHLINQYDTNAVYPDIVVPFLYSDSVITVSWNIITPADPSWVPMQVMIDYADIIEEDNELDNQAIRPFTNGNFNVPGGIKITAGGSASACQSTFYSVCGNAKYINTAVVLRDPSVAGAEVKLRIVETGQEFTDVTNSKGNYCISFIAPADTGRYSVEITITDFTIEGDTTFSFSVIECPVPPDPDGPDLLSKIILDAGEVFAGIPITGKVKITNEGNEPAGASVAHVYLNSLGVASAQNFAVPPLAPGAFYITDPFSFISPLTSGSETVSSFADVNKQVTELKENNNDYHAGVRICPSLPDLEGGGPVFADNFGGLFLCHSDLTFSVSNFTCVTVTDAFDVQVQVYQNSNLVFSETRTITTDVLRDNAISGITFTNVFPAAGNNYRILFLVDINNSIPEFNESNNVRSTPFFEVVDCKPDLALTSGCNPVTPVDPAIPGTISVSTTLVNGGLATAIAPFVVDFEVGGNHFPVTINTNLPVGSSVPVIATFPTPPYGCPIVTVTADATNVLDEYKENDNTHKIDLSWDFSLWRICYDPDPDEFGNVAPNPNFWEEPHSVGEPVLIAIGIVNYSTYTASLVHTRFEVSGPGITGWLDLGFGSAVNVDHTCGICKSTMEISPLQVTLPNSFVFPQEGIYKVRMTSDADERYLECNEANNVMIVDVTIKNSADYRILSQFIAPSLLNPKVGEPITMDVTYQNIGASNILDSLDIQVKVDNLPHQTVRVKGLLKGSTFTAHFGNPWASLKSGLHIIRAIADPKNKIPEASELNNQATRSFVVGRAANLYFQVFSPSNSFPLVGETILLNARIGNSGDLNCDADVQFFYINDLQDSIPVGTTHVSVTGRDSSTITLPWIVLDNTTTLVGRIINPSAFQLKPDEGKEAVAFLADIGLSIVSTPGCFGGNDGTLTAYASGGNPPFTFNWSTGDTGMTITAPPGLYTVTVTNSGGSSRTISGKIKALPPPSFYEDADGDGFGNPNSIVEECSAPAGYVSNDSDCNDAKGAIHPGATEVCNGIDDNCNGQTDEGVLLTFFKDEDNDLFGNPAIKAYACTAPTGYVADSLDCNDAKINIHPGVPEVCNGLDDNCSGQIDEGVATMFFRDFDSDGYGNPNATTLDCSLPPGFVTNNADCDDKNAAISPAKAEVCNGIDDNCNGSVDEGVLLTFFRDADGDGFGNPDNSVMACTAPAGYKSNSSDCNDSNGNIRPTAPEICNSIDDNCNGQTDEGVLLTFYLDADGDNFGSPVNPVNACVVPPGYVANDFDCDDENLNVNPGAFEICNNVDDNCNGVVDEGVQLTFFRDADGDGYGNPAISTQSCTVPAGYVADDNDCNDANAGVYPGRAETCNGIDDNCNTVIDEGVQQTFFRDADGDTYGNPAISKQACAAPAGYVLNNTDCNDANANVRPGASEVCNGLDDNCNGAADEGVKLTFYRDADGDTYGNPAVTTQACTAPAGYVSNSLDCNDANANVHPERTEICNTIDDNCNGQIDEGVLLTFYRDADGDTYGNPAITTQACSAPAGYVSNTTDCNDGNANVYPGHAEICDNGIDDNCNGQADENCNTCTMTVSAGIDESTFFGVSGFQSVSHTVTPTGGTAPYTFTWTLNRPLKCNVVNSSGNETFSVTGGSCSNNTCPKSGSLSTPPSCTSSGSSSTINVTLLDTGKVCVLVRDSRGCTATACFMVNAIDARCFTGNAGKNKVLVCHRTGSAKNPWVQICVDKNAVSALLAKGDYLGTCKATARFMEDQQQENNQGIDNLVVYPNPAHHLLNIKFDNNKTEEYILQLMDMTGRVVANKINTLQEGSILLTLDLTGFASGIYTLSLINAEGSRQVKVMVE